jgi:GNAT superfamily N-acetyltransferase
VSDVEVRPLDRDSEAQVRAFWEVERDAVAERPYNDHLAWEAARTYIPMEFPDRLRMFMAAWDGDRMVATLHANGSTVDNLHRAYVNVSVLPDRRREGVGSLLLDEARRWALADGRRVLAAEVIAPLAESSPGLAFAEHHGFRVMLEDGMKVVDIPETRDRWAGLAAEAAPHHRGYELRTAWAPLPAELVDGFIAINNMFVSEAPSGDADVEDESWDEVRLRALEERAAAAGRRDVRTFAVTLDGEVAAMTEAFVNENVPHRGFQGGTLVVPAHRGHRLGMAVKVANQRALAERFPELAWIVTGNADVNVHMNAINDRLGFRTVERCLEVEKEI